MEKEKMEQKIKLDLDELDLVDGGSLTEDIKVTLSSLVQMYKQSRMPLEFVINLIKEKSGFAAADYVAKIWPDIRDKNE